MTQICTTYNGILETTLDAYLVVEAVLQGKLLHVPRRVQDRERASVITSGSVFVYEEFSSGIKRWTDGLSWSPSRMSGPFLLYREIEEQAPSPDQNGVLKARKRAPLRRKNSSMAATAGVHKPYRQPQSAASAVDKKWVGSLTDTYNFKEGGLVKRTCSIHVRGMVHHVCSYYTVEDAREGRLLRPSNHPQIRDLYPRLEIIYGQGWKSIPEGIFFTDRGAIILETGIYIHVVKATALDPTADENSVFCVHYPRPLPNIPNNTIYDRDDPSRRTFARWTRELPQGPELAGFVDNALAHCLQWEAALLRQNRHAMGQHDEQPMMHQHGQAMMHQHCQAMMHQNSQNGQVLLLQTLPPQWPPQPPPQPESEPEPKLESPQHEHEHDEYENQWQHHLQPHWQPQSQQQNGQQQHLHPHWQPQSQQAHHEQPRLPLMESLPPPLPASLPLPQAQLQQSQHQPQYLAQDVLEPALSHALHHGMPPMEAQGGDEQAGFLQEVDNFLDDGVLFNHFL